MGYLYSYISYFPLEETTYNYGINTLLCDNSLFAFGYLSAYISESRRKLDCLYNAQLISCSSLCWTSVFLLLLTHIIWNFYPSLFFKCQVCFKYTAWIDMDLGSRLFSNITEWRKTTILICSLKIDLQHMFGIAEDGRCSNDSACRATVRGFPL